MLLPEHFDFITFDILRLIVVQVLKPEIDGSEVLQELLQPSVLLRLIVYSAISSYLTIR